MIFLKNQHFIIFIVTFTFDRFLSLSIITLYLRCVLNLDFSVRGCDSGNDSFIVFFVYVL